jgi:FdhE protein
MESINNETETLAEEIRQVLAEQPHVESLLNAFGPLLLEKSRWLAGVRNYKKTFPVDAIQYEGGISLMQQCQLFLPEDLWKSAGLAVALGIGQGFSRLAEDIKGLSEQIADGRFDCFSLIHSTVESDDEQLTSQAEGLGVEPALLQVFLQFLTRFMLTKRAQDMAAELAPLAWKKGYCPVCGSFPQLAIIRDKGHRWLQCSDCSHEWQFPRLTCPYCDHEDPENTNYVFVEGKKEDTAFICSKCRRYLVTANRSETLRQTHPDVIAISLAHLDLILQGKGFMPMSECEWNTFKAGPG